MTLLDDLRALDLAPILDARAQISVGVDLDVLHVLADGGPAMGVLGEVGTTLRALQELAEGSLTEPATLVGPLTEVLGGLVDDLARALGAGDLPLRDYAEAVAAAARVVAGLVGRLDGDLGDLTVAGTSLQEGLGGLGGAWGGYAVEVGRGLSRVRALVDTVERGLPADPSLLLAPALEILLPMPAADLDELRRSVGALLARVAGLAVDPGRCAGLVAALGEVRLAAHAGDRSRLEGALQTLARVRAATVQQLGADLRRLSGGLAGLDVAGALQRVGRVRSLLDSADETALDLLSGWAGRIAELRGLVGSLDAAAAMAGVGRLLDLAEQAVESTLVAAVDQSVRIAEDAVRDLLRELGLRALRHRLGAALSSVAEVVADADLEAPVTAVRQVLVEARTVLAEADPAAVAREATAALDTALGSALDDLEAALAQVTGGIESVADAASEVLGRAVAAVRDLRALLDDLQRAVEDLGIDRVAAEVGARLRELREQVAALVSGAPLPDALRDSVGGLVDLLEGIDVAQAVGVPLHRLADEIAIPDQVADAAREGLSALADATAALVPADVAADLDGLVGDLLAQIEGLDLGPVADGVAAVVDEARAALAGLDLVALVAPAGAAYDEVVRVVDRAHPQRLLAPVIGLYDDLLGHLPVPDPETLSTRAAGLMAGVGEGLARAASAPVTTALGGRPAGAAPAAGEGSGRAVAEPPADLRPGDVLRMLGFLPARLREALLALDADDAGVLLRQVDALLGGLAADLRRAREVVVGLERAAVAVLEPALAGVTAAQVDALMALEASAAVRVDGFALEASVGLVAGCGAAGLEASLAADVDLLAARARSAGAALGGRVAADLDAAAELLEALLPGEVLADVAALAAALDPEPVAAELDALTAAVVEATPAFLDAAAGELAAVEARVRSLLERVSPGRLVQRYLAVLDVVREELEVLDPRRLAAELGEVHRQVLTAVEAYDPRVVAADLQSLVTGLVGVLDGLDPAAIVPDLSVLSAHVARVESLLPSRALAGVGSQLEQVGEELRAVDVAGLLAAVDDLPTQLADAIDDLVRSLQEELVALLRSVRYAQTGVSVTVAVPGGGP